MKTLLVLLLAAVALGCAHCPPATCRAGNTSANREIFKFEKGLNLSGWEVEDDIVMGGRSRGRLEINEAGNAVFTGRISLDNDGGFSSIQYTFDPVAVSKYTTLVLGLKGDGKPYQVRVESERRARHAYTAGFQTSGDWETIEIPFASMVAIRHGDRLDLPNYPGQQLSRIQILFGNGAAESFELEIDRLWLK
jgi:NADH dehydrogenase [ubiquinone] 1 alpha subcomplex assembly factor 1